MCFLQVKAYIQQNGDLRSALDKLRMEQANSPGMNDKASQALSGSNSSDNTNESQYGAEYLSLKVCQRKPLY